MKPVQIGDTLINLGLPDNNQNLLEISKYFGKKNVVLILYPTSEKNQCGSGDCCLSKIIGNFNNDNVRIFGISGKSSVTDCALGDDIHIPILSDQKGQIRRLLGVPSINFGKYTKLFYDISGLNPARIIVVINTEGKVIYITETKGWNKCQPDEGYRISLILNREGKIN